MKLRLDGKIDLVNSPNPGKIIILFALPFFAGDIFHVFYTMIDAYVIGRRLGINGLAAVGAGGSLIWFVYGFCHGLTDGFLLTTAQRVGAGEEEGIRRSVAAVLSLCFLISVILTLILLPVSGLLLALIQTPAEIINEAWAYIFILFSGVLLVLFSNMLAGIIRAGGNSFSPMVIFVLGTLCKIVLVLIFVVLLPWGVRGAALATLLADLIKGLLCLGFLFRRFPHFMPRRQDWIPDLREYWAHLSLGISVALMRSIIEVGNILLQSAINGLGALSIAAVAASQRVRGLSIIPVFSISRAMAIYTAQNYGAGKLDRVYKGLRQICLIGLGLGFFVGVLNLFGGVPIVSILLQGNAEAVSLARQYIIFNGSTVFVLALMLAFRSTLQGLGMKYPPLICGGAETLMCVLAAFVLIPRFGFTGVSLASPLAWMASLIPLCIAFGVFRAKNKVNGA